jgi:NADH dehydrogenase FAD-containing subunit
MSHTYKKFFAKATGGSTTPVGTALGYPVPGPQVSNAQDIATHAFFASPAEWEQIKNASYDFIVIGTGPTGVAFVAPPPDLMRDWPQELIDVTLKDGFWERAKTFLHVTTMDKINDGVYGNL